MNICFSACCFSYCYISVKSLCYWCATDKLSYVLIPKVHTLKIVCVNSQFQYQFMQYQTDSYKSICNLHAAVDNNECF